MKQFEYLITKLSDMSLDFDIPVTCEQVLLNKMGEQGWELVHVSQEEFVEDDLYYFKREKN